MQLPKKKLIKFLCMSDTHGQTDSIDLSEEQGDIFIHGGDFTKYSREEDISSFLNYLDRLKFKHKIVICGNHEISYDRNATAEMKKRRQHASKRPPEQLLSQLRKHCIYLEHEMIEIEGIKIFGSPYINKGKPTAFSYEKVDSEGRWVDIPKVDILVTHGPPYGIADLGKVDSKHLGCPSLLQKIKEIRPKYHLFGHIHESGGKSFTENETIFVNISQCGSHQVLSFKPFKFTFQSLGQ